MNESCFCFCWIDHLNRNPDDIKLSSFALFAEVRNECRLIGINFKRR